VIGVGQLMTHSSDPQATEPMHLWAEACSRAIADAGARRGIAGLGGLSVVRCDSWSYDTPVARLAHRLGVAPRLLVDSRMGGHQPQLLLHVMADAIARGQLDLGMVVSGEALHTVEALNRESKPLPWSNPATPPPEAKLGDYFCDAEINHGMLPIMRSFALRDTARRAHLGIAVEDYAREPAPTYGAMSEVAAANPYAWHPLARSPDEILQVCPSNRMPVHPYTKLMMAAPKVNQAAALLLASTAEADAIGVPIDRRVYLRGWSAANDYPYVAENEDLWCSHAMEDAAHRALAAATVRIDDITHFDLYSCFPSSVRFASDALGRPLDDRRGVTVTGGMPYAGAPGSGYVTQALATMTQVLRQHDGDVGLVSGLSAQMATHAFTVLSAVPAVGNPTTLGDTTVSPPRGERVTIRDWGRGPATLEAYAVACTREGTDDLAVAICRLPDHSRCYAQAHDAELLTWLASSEGTGLHVELTVHDDGRTHIGNWSPSLGP
jgi:acetyl-CoA C-acetyltransferase